MLQFQHGRWTVFVSSAILDFMYLIYSLLDATPFGDFFLLLKGFRCWPKMPIFWWCVNNIVRLSLVHFVYQKVVSVQLIKPFQHCRFDRRRHLRLCLPNLLANAVHNNRMHDLPASSNTSSIGSCAFLYSSSVMPCHIISLTSSGSKCTLAPITTSIYIQQIFGFSPPVQINF